MLIADSLLKARRWLMQSPSAHRNRVRLFCRRMLLGVLFCTGSGSDRTNKIAHRVQCGVRGGRTRAVWSGNDGGLMRAAW